VFSRLSHACHKYPDFFHWSDFFLMELNQSKLVIKAISGNQKDNCDENSTDFKMRGTEFQSSSNHY
jgi:hypothetical protein